MHQGNRAGVYAVTTLTTYRGQFEITCYGKEEHSYELTLKFTHSKVTAFLWLVMVLVSTVSVYFVSSSA